MRRPKFLAAPKLDAFVGVIDGTAYGRLWTAVVPLRAAPEKDETAASIAWADRLRLGSPERDAVAICAA